MRLFGQTRSEQAGSALGADFTARQAHPRIDAFTFWGLAIALLGWGVLIAALMLSDVFLKAGSLVALISLRSDLVTLAQTTILSGFALAVIGALRAGFGALNRFFDAVLQRSSAPRPAPVVEVPEPESVSVTTPAERFAQANRLKERNYVVLPDGSVEVETLLGTRIFATLEEARDFIH